MQRRRGRRNRQIIIESDESDEEPQGDSDYEQGEEEEDEVEILSRRGGRRRAAGSSSSSSGRRRKRNRIPDSQPSQPSSRSQRRRLSSSQSSSSSQRNNGVDEDYAYDDEDYSEEERKTWDNLEHKQKEKMIGDVFRFLLFNHSKKLPVPKEKLSKEVFKNKRMFTTDIREKAISRAKARFTDIFGYELVEMKNLPVASLAPAATQRKSAKTVYILKSFDDASESLKSNEWNKDGEAHRSLVMMILGFIFIGGGQIAEGVLWSKLETLGLGQRENHDDFGDMKKMVKSLEVQSYLKRVKDERATEEAEDGSVKWLYIYGSRALMETSEEKIYTFVTKLLGQEPNPAILRELRKKQDEINAINDAPQGMRASASQSSQMSQRRSQRRR